jgi:hypothetical protein
MLTETSLKRRQDFQDQLNVLTGQQNAIAAQLQGVVPCRALSQRRAALQAQYDAADAAEDFEQLGALGLQLDAVALDAAQLLVTEAGCAGLAGRHAELLRQLRLLAQAVLEVVMSEGAEFDVLQKVCTALVEAQNMDLSVLSAEVAATVAAIGVDATAAAGMDEDGAWDPVYVSNTAVSGAIVR